jgi:hypothetical protein
VVAGNRGNILELKKMKYRIQGTEQKKRQRRIWLNAEYLELRDDM